MSEPRTKARVVVSKDGPYLVTGGVPLAEQVIGTDAEGGSETWEQGKAYETQDSYALCRCGRSRKKPFCDGTHSRVGFDGTETASREPYSKQAEVQDGPAELALMDAEHLCAFARFCDPHGQVWTQIDRTDDPEVHETSSGRSAIARPDVWWPGTRKGASRSSRNFLCRSASSRTRLRNAAALSGCAAARNWYQRMVPNKNCATA
jgi:CDGSH-type Zn-finger protein